MSLPVQLPVCPDRSLDLLWFPLGSCPVRFRVVLSKTAKITDLKACAAKCLDVPLTILALREIVGNRYVSMCQL